jgi:hypothetical protein
VLKYIVQMGNEGERGATAEAPSRGPLGEHRYFVHNGFPAEWTHRQLIVSRAGIAEAEVPTREQHD